MIPTAQILESIDHITEELTGIKKALLVLEIGGMEKSKKAWERIIKSSQGVKWDEVNAVEEIRNQRETYMLLRGTKKDENLNHEEHEFNEWTQII